MSTTPTQDPTAYTDLVREYADIQARIAPDLARLEDIKKILRTDLDYGTHDIAGLRVTVSKNARLDAAKFAAAFPQADFPDYYKTAPDTTAIRKHLAPAVIEALSTSGDARLTVK